MDRQRQTEEFARWFKDHRATFAEYGEEDITTYPIQTLAWKQVDSGMYMIRYVIQGSVLMVWGDLESAVYRWSSRISWEFLAGCDLQYFEGKCEASPRGRDYEEFDRDDALADLNQWVKEQDDGWEPANAQLVAEAHQAIRYGEEDWREWLRANGYDLFGDGWYEFAPSFGKRIAVTCAAHLAGIKMAVAQRKVSDSRDVFDREFAVDPSVAVQ